MVSVPSQYVQMVKDAAQKSGLPESVVAAQINLESGFNPNAKSGAGAEGIAQFLPSTFSQYGTGSPYNPQDAFNAYANYMSTLLKQEGGSVYKALEAYNAGPGNLGAGSGYASQILSAAKQPLSLGSKGGSGSGGGGILSALDPATWVADIGKDIVAPFLKFVLWGFEFIVGFALIGFGGFMVMQQSDTVKKAERDVGELGVDAAVGAVAPEAEPAIMGAEEGFNKSSDRRMAERKQQKAQVRQAQQQRAAATSAAGLPGQKKPQQSRPAQAKPLFTGGEFGF